MSSLGYFMQRSFITPEEKMDLHKFALCKYVANMSLKSKYIYMAKMVNFTFAYQKTGRVKLLSKRGIYHVCHTFTPQYLYTCDIFARSNFVQIHFFVPS